MINTLHKVKTFGRGSDWGYRVHGAGGETLVSRRHFPTELAARNAGWAASKALAPMAIRLRFTPEHEVKTTSRVSLQTTPKPSFWSSLFQ
jgi:hypothetical protein